MVGDRRPAGGLGLLNGAVGGSQHCPMPHLITLLSSWLSSLCVFPSLSLTCHLQALQPLYRRILPSTHNRLPQLTRANASGTVGGHRYSIPSAPRPPKPPPRPCTQSPSTIEGGSARPLRIRPLGTPNCAMWYSNPVWAGELGKRGWPPGAPAVPTHCPHCPRHDFGGRVWAASGVWLA